MRYAASEKLESIRTVEDSSLGLTRTLGQLDIPKSTFYHWYDRYLTGGVAALEDQKPTPHANWSKVPEDKCQALVEMALERSELSPRELAVRFTDEPHYFISEATAYRILKAHDLVTSPAWIVLKAARSIRSTDHGHQSTVANGLHIPEGDRLWLVFPLDRDG